MYKYFIALRYLRGRMITWLAIAGVTIGVMALVIVTSVMGGFQIEMHDRIRGTMGHLSVESKEFFGLRGPAKIEKAVETLPHVTGTSPFIESIALFSSDTLDWGKIKGIDPVKEMTVGKFHKYLLTDEESEAYGKIEALERDNQRYSEALKAPRISWIYEAMLEKGMSREKVKKELLKAVKLYEISRKAGGNVQALKKFKVEFDKWTRGLGVPMNQSEIDTAYEYGARLGLIEKNEKRIEELEEIKDAKADRPPFKKEKVEALFTTKRKRTHAVDLEYGGTLSGKLVSENSTHVSFEIPWGNSSRVETRSRDELDGPVYAVPPMVVGIQWFKWYNVDLHDLVNIITVRPDNLTRTFSKKFEVVGAFKTGMFETDYRFVYTSVRALQEFLDLSGRVSGISIRLDDYSNAQTAFPAIEAEVKRFDDTGFYRVSTWEDKHKTLLDAVKIEKWLLYFILIFMIIIAGFMNLCILTMMVVEKTKDLGIIKAIGGTTGGVFSIFFFTGGFIGAIGTLIGCILGGLFTIFINEIADFVEMLTGVNPFPKNIYYLDSIPTAFMPMELVFIIVPAVAISFLFSLYPAFRAAQMNPIEAFGHE